MIFWSSMSVRVFRLKSGHKTKKIYEQSVALPSGFSSNDVHIFKEFFRHA